MLDILALCTCACITTCIWCAVASLTCPRVIGVPIHCNEESGIFRSSHPSNFQHVKNWNFERSGQKFLYPRPRYCPNISYPILMYPIDTRTQNYFQPYFLSSSTSLQPSTSGVSSFSDSTPQKSRVSSKATKGEKLGPPDDREESIFSPESNSDENFKTKIFNDPPQPPPRLKRNRLKSILKSKFKRRESTDLENPPLSSNSRPDPLEKKSDKETETVSLPNVSYKLQQDPNRLQDSPIISRFHVLRRLCGIPSSKQRSSPKGSKRFKSDRCSPAAAPFPNGRSQNQFRLQTSNPTFVHPRNSRDRKIYHRDRSTSVSSDDHIHCMNPSRKGSRLRDNREKTKR